MSKKRVTIQPKLGDKPVVFERAEEGESISSETMVVIIDEASDLI